MAAPLPERQYRPGTLTHIYQLEGVLLIKQSASQLSLEIQALFSFLEF
jgi:hypothetical protein